MQGTIKRLIMDKGFGFIAVEGQEGGKDLFFHVSGLSQGLRIEDLQEGDAVTFEASESPKGPCAVNVAKADMADMAA